MLAHLIMAVLFALLFSFVVVSILQRQGPGPRGGFLFFFLALFLAIWAGGIWLTEFGPQLLGAPIMDFLVVGLVLTLLIASLTHPRRRAIKPRTDEHRGQERELEAASVVAIGAFFWVFLALLAVSIVVRYLQGS